jgi:16S rRNA G966 N2-methylase RsmD
VDSSPGAVRAINENLRRTHLADRATVRCQDALRALRAGVEAFDLVLLDPPYRTPGADLDALMAEIAAQGAVSAAATVVLTRPKGGYTPVIPIHWRPVRQLSYGDMLVCVFHTP